MNAYFLGHNGLGDNLYSIGALRYLSRFYEKIYFLCKDKNLSNIELLFSDTDKIVCVPFGSDNEFNNCKNIIMNKYQNNDVFICGECHKGYLRSKITNQDLLKERLPENKYTLDYDMINSDNYGFLEQFYLDINLNLTIFFDYWKIPVTMQSKQLYDSVKKYEIIFLQTKCSTGYSLSIQGLLDKYLHNKKTILISNDENLYNSVDEKIDHIQDKKKLCDQFINNKFTYYLDTIINSKEIYIIDSCFVGIILPLKKKNILKADIVRIIKRKLSHTIEL